MLRQIMSGGIVMLLVGACLSASPIWSQEKRPASGNDTVRPPATKASEPAAKKSPPAATTTEANLYKALESPTVVEFVETPLADVLSYLKDFHKVQIGLDQLALDGAGVGLDTPITMNLRGVTMRSALEMILRKHRLSSMVQNEVILITTEEVASRQRETTIYDVAELLGESSTAELAEVVLQSLVPVSQRDESSDISVVPFRHLLIVRHNQAGQRQVAQFLQQLRGALNAM